MNDEKVFAYRAEREVLVRRLMKDTGPTTHIFDHLNVNETMCGSPAMNDSHKMSHHEIKRGRITCGLCLKVHMHETAEREGK